MKILQIGPFPLDPMCIQGGIESSVFGLSIGLSKRHDVVVIDFPRSGIRSHCEEVDGIKVFRIERKGKRNISAAKSTKEVLQIIHQQKPDICHIHGTNSFSCKIYKSISYFPKLLTVHGIACEEKKKALFQHFSFITLSQFLYQTYYERSILSVCDNIIADTDYVKDAILKLGVVKESCISVIPQGISDDFYELSHVLEKNHPMLLSVGSLSPRKGHLLLMRAFDRVWKENSSIQLVIAGICTNKAYFSEMMRLKEELSSCSSISILPNAEINQLKQFYQKASAFALHSQEESQGIVFAEAMAYGLPIISTMSGGIPFVVRNGVNGLLSEYEDIDTFSTNISRIFSDEQIRDSMRDNNRNESLKYLWGNIVEKVLQLYSIIIDDYC